MQLSYLSTSSNTRPDIIEVVGRYTSLRKVGREFVGLSPCHKDRNPSLRVNPDKQVWYCDPCASGGDVIRFIELIEQTDFRGALKILGIDNKDSNPKPVDRRKRQAAAMAAAWMAEQRYKVNVLLGDVLEKIELADEIGDSELAESFIREQSFLRDLYEDLAIARYASDFLLLKDSIEQITEATA